MTRPRISPLTASLLVACAAASWGCWSLVLRPVALPAVASSALIMGVQGALLLLVVAREPLPRPWDRTSLALVAALAVTDSLNVVAYFHALEVTTVGIAVLTHYLAPVLIAMAAPWVEGRRVPRAVATALVALAGLGLVLEPWRDAGGDRVTGALLGALSAVGYAANVFIATRLIPRIGTARLISFHNLLAAALLLPLVPWTAALEAPWRSWALVAAGACVMGALAGWAFVTGLAVIGSTRTAMLTYLEPLVAVVVGAVAWDERLGACAAIGAALILLSGAWITVGQARAAQAS